MANWTISVVQLPIVFDVIGDTGYKHNIIVIRDGNGNFYREINGGPSDSNGAIIDFRNSFQAYTAYTSGQYLVGAEVFSSPHYYNAGLGTGALVYSGTEQEVLARFGNLLICVGEINAS